jgi:hypothetical protein
MRPASRSSAPPATRKPTFIVKNHLGQRISASTASPEDIATAQHAYFELYERYDSQHPVPSELLIPSTLSTIASPMTLTTEPEMSEPTMEELQRRILEQQIKQNDQNERRAEEKHRAELAAIQGPPKDPATGMSTNPSVTRVLRSIPGVNASVVTKIVNNTFSLKDLAGLLRLAKPIILEEVVSLNDDRMAIRMPRGYDLKDFGFNSRIWCHSFLAYMRVVMALHGAEHPDVMDAMVAFVCDTMNFTEVYHWQFAVLPLAIAWHEQVLHTGPLVAENWKIDPLWRDLYINSAAVAKTTPPKSPTPVQKPKGATKASIHAMN